MSSGPSIRLYGMTDNSSFGRVTDGMKGALHELGLLAGFVPIDKYDDEAVYEGHDAELAVFVGTPSAAPMMTSIGWHKERLALLPANSSWMPERLVESLGKGLTGWIAPSRWAAGILKRYSELPVEVWQHGVSPAFERHALAHQALVQSYNEGQFSVLHVASTHTQRKGTRELIRAWGSAVQDKKLGSDPKLCMVVDCPQGYFDDTVKEVGCENNVFWRHRMNLSPLKMANFYRSFHLVAQPSRGEGFGMVPLEARASGVPAMMTTCTGHAEHWCDEGIIPIQSWEPFPIDDGPDALAPRLEFGDVKLALEHAYENWHQFAKEAQDNAAEVFEHWNWTAVTQRWLNGRNT